MAQNSEILIEFYSKKNQQSPNRGLYYISFRIIENRDKKPNVRLLLKFS